MTTAAYAPQVDPTTEREIRKNIDKQARAAFNISGEEFLKRWREGRVRDLDHSIVIRLEFAARAIQA